MALTATARPTSKAGIETVRAARIGDSFLVRGRRYTLRDYSANFGEGPRGEFIEVCVFGKARVAGARKFVRVYDCDEVRVYHEA